jgi:hypothetical protein
MNALMSFSLPVFTVCGLYTVFCFDDIDAFMLRDLKVNKEFNKRFAKVGV